MVKLARNGGSPRGTRIGAGPRGDVERGAWADRTRVDYFCSQGHQCALSFAAQAEIPEHWECPHCGLPAGRDPHNAPPVMAIAPYKTHLDYVRERRSDADAELLLNEALARLRNA